MRGSINENQALALHVWVQNREVHDFGAGDLQLSIAMLHLGAKTVVAVDKEHRHLHMLQASDGLKLVGEHFDRFVARDPVIDVAFISWPVVYGTQGLAELTRRAKTVIYLGSNFNGTVCGSNELWQHLRGREIELSVSDPRNTLIIYGKHDPTLRRRLDPEEYAAYRRDIDEEPYRYGSLDGQRLYAP